MEGFLIRINATVNGVSIPLETRSQYQMLHDLLGIYLKSNIDEGIYLSTEDEETPTYPIPRVPPRPKPLRPYVTEINGISNGLRPRGTNPPVGERVEDIMQAVLREYPNGLTYVQLDDKMIQAGWQTRAQQRIRLLRSYVSVNKEAYVRMPNGKLKLKPQPISESEADELLRK